VLAVFAEKDITVCLKGLWTSSEYAASSNLKTVTTSDSGGLSGFQNPGYRVPKSPDIDGACRPTGYSDPRRTRASGQMRWSYII